MRYTVITSIYPPGEAVEGFASQEGNHLIVSGDKKTPTDWAHKDTSYLSPENQISLPFRTVTKLPWNHYCRKMAGYLYAMREGATQILDTDDDNIPYSGYNFPQNSIEALTTKGGLGFVNVYQNFQLTISLGPTPDKIDSQGCLTKKHGEEVNKIAIWQGLGLRSGRNAICLPPTRIPSIKGLMDTKKPGVHLTLKIPFSQAQLLSYLPAFVTFRFTDILRGYVAQPILQQHVQTRFYQQLSTKIKCPRSCVFADDHCYMPKDVDISVESVSKEKSVNENLSVAYDSLHKKVLYQMKTPFWRHGLKIVINS